MKNNQAKNVKPDDQDLPGYPHYPESEDILNTEENKTERVPVDVENISRSLNVNSTIQNAGAPKSMKAEKSVDPEAEVELVPGNEADVTAEDLAALGEEGLSLDDGDDELLRNRPNPLIVGDSGLDVPGAELDDTSEILGNEDEENNYYSLGGDNHENLENQS
jgi:hypothetical protein